MVNVRGRESSAGGEKSEKVDPKAESESGLRIQVAKFQSFKYLCGGQEARFAD